VGQRGGRAEKPAVRPKIWQLSNAWATTQLKKKKTTILPGTLEIKRRATGVEDPAMTVRKRADSGEKTSKGGPSRSSYRRDGGDKRVK